VATQTPGQLRHLGGIGRVEYSLTYRSFASFNEPYNLVRFMYGRRTCMEKEQLAFNF